MRLNRNKIIFAWILLLTGMSGFLNVGAVMEFLIPVSHVTELDPTRFVWQKVMDQDSYNIC